MAAVDLAQGFSQEEVAWTSADVLSTQTKLLAVLAAQASEILAAEAQGVGEEFTFWMQK